MRKKFLLLTVLLPAFLVGCSKKADTLQGDGSALVIGDTLVVSPAEGGVKFVTVNSNCSWSAEALCTDGTVPDWISLSPSIGIGQDTLWVMFDFNSVPKERRAVIIVSPVSPNLVDLATKFNVRQEPCPE